VTTHVRQQWRRRNLWFGVGVALVSLALYIGWAWINDVTVDAVGLGIAAAGPFVLAFVWWVIWFRFRAPGFVLDQYKGYFDRANPPSPWSVAVEVQAERIALRLLLTKRYTAGPEISSASCRMTIGDLNLVSDAKSGPVTQEKGLEWMYPRDFPNAVWPIERGTYEAACEVRIADGSSHTIGARVKVR